jgi:hypothetical protein
MKTSAMVASATVCAFVASSAMVTAGATRSSGFSGRRRGALAAHRAPRAGGRPGETARSTHVLLPEGQWAETGAWVVLPPPEDEEVESVLHRLLRQVRGLLSEVEETWPEEDLDVLRAQGAQHRLQLHESVPKK